MGSVFGWDPSTVQVLWESIQQFLCNPANKPTNQQTDTDENATSLKEVTINQNFIADFIADGIV